MPRTAGRADTRGAIIQVALELFGTQGYEATPLRQIAEQLDVTSAALYYHFPAKDDLLAAIVQPLFDGTEEILGLTPDSSASLVEMFLELLLREHKVAHLVWSDPAVPNHAEIGPRRQRVFDRFEAQLAGPDASEEDRVRAQCAIQVMRTVAAMPADRARRMRTVVSGAAAAVLAAR